MASRRRVVVVGGGVAGLAAALRLADAGVSVSLFEKRAIAGGRAYSYRAREAGHVVDNGQHVLMGCYDRTLAYLERVGRRDRVETQRRLSVPLVAAGGRAVRFACAPVPAPLHLTLGALGYGHLAPRARARLLAGGVRFLARRLRGRGLEGKTVAEVLDELGQGEAERTAFWDPLAIAVLNELPGRAAATLFGEVLRRVFLAPARASSIVFPGAGLSELFVDPAVAVLERAGSRVETGRAVHEVVVREGRAAGVRLGDGETVESDAVVVAVPPAALAPLLPARLREEAPVRGVARLRASPIVSVHLWLRERLPTPRMLGFLEGPIQWLFTPPMQPSQGTYVTLVSSGAHDLVSRAPDEILAEARRTFDRDLPAARGLAWSDALVAKERAATWAATPAEQPDRPGAETPLRGLFLAGDWTDTGLPGTLEGAIGSGERAASLCLP